MRAKSVPLSDWLQYLAIRSLESSIKVFPWRFGTYLAGVVGDFMGLLDRPCRKARTADDLRQAFPGLSDQDIRKTVRDVYRNLVKSVLDTMNLLRFGRDGYADFLETEGFEQLEQTRGSRQGVIFVTGHFGCWELLGAAGAALGWPVWSLARPLKNSLLNDYLQRIRESSGQYVLTKRGSMQETIRLLRGGQNVAFLIDQDARKEGIFVDFFGRPASTFSSVARMSIYTGAPVALVYARRIGEQIRFKAVLKDVTWPRREAPPEEEVARITQAFTKGLEAAIRESPSDWLWLHDRWKTYPGKYKG